MLLTNINLTMKENLIFLVILSFLGFSSYGQEVQDNQNSNRIAEEIPVKKEFKAQQLTYAAEIPATDSYSIIVNTYNVGLSKEQLLQMNKYRSFEESVEWKISDDLILLLKPFN